MPMGPYKDFSACLMAQGRKGRSKTSASRICGEIKARTEGKKKIEKANMSNLDLNFSKYLPISKVNDEERMVYGYASTPDLDSQGEVVELNAIKSALPNYMKFPTIREMHTTNAVGRTKSAVVDDKGLFIGAKIVDDNAWKKVKEGVFNGFSIGGRAIQMVGNVIKELRLTEISLVDVPANKSAVITLFKNDSGLNTTEQTYKNYLVKFAFNWEEVSKLEEVKKQEEIVNEVAEQVEEQVVNEEQVVAEEGLSGEELAEVEAVLNETENTEATTDEPTETLDIESTLDKIEKMEKAYEKQIQKFDSIEKMDKAISKLTSVVEKLSERLEKVENTPAESKTKASFLVEKTLGGTQIEKQESVELVKAKSEFADLMKIRETNPERYALEKMSDRAFELKDRIARLS